MELISSSSNLKIKLVRALRQRKIRQESGLYLIEGIHHVGEAIEATASGSTNIQVESIYYAPDLLESEYARQLVESQLGRGLPCYGVAAEVFVSLAEKDNPQGILAVARQSSARLDNLAPVNFSWGVALVSPQDPGNLGTILRTIDAVGADGLLLLDSQVDPYHPNAVRASMGTLFWHAVVSARFEEFTSWAKQHDYHVYGTSAHASLDYRNIPGYHRPCILLLGSEQKGLSSEQMAACQTLAALPMIGRASSLNLAVAAGVMLYAMLESIEKSGRTSSKG